MADAPEIAIWLLNWASCVLTTFRVPAVTARLNRVEPLASCTSSTPAVTSWANVTSRAFWIVSVPVPTVAACWKLTSPVSARTVRLVGWSVPPTRLPKVTSSST